MDGMTIRSRIASVVAFAVLAAAGVAHAEESELKYFVEVSVASLEWSSSIS
jgi:hypothetical protein